MAGRTAAVEMETLDTDSLARWTGGIWKNLPFRRTLGNFAIDGRRVRPGDCFIALKTDRDDGLNYLDQAARSGADFAMVSRFRSDVALPQLVVGDTMVALAAAAAAYRRTWSNPTVAVVGSFGKTTTKNLLVRLLGADGGTNEGNENNGLGVPLNLLRFRPELHPYGVFEVGISQPGEMGPIAEILRPTDVIFTGLSQKHLEFFPSMDELFREKLRICSDYFGRLIMGHGLSRRAVGLGVPLPPILSVARGLPSESRDFWSADLYYDFEVVGGRGRCDLVHREGAVRIEESFWLPFPSAGLAFDLALCRGLLLGISQRQSKMLPTVPDRESITRRLLGWRALPLRGQIFRSAGHPYYVDCYNSDLRALWDSVATFRRLFPGLPRLYILGSMAELGSASRRSHGLAGRIFPLDLGDRLVLIGPEMEAMAAGLLARGFARSQVRWFPDVRSVQLPTLEVGEAVYLKGSRIHRLENLFNFSAMESIESLDRIGL